MNSMLNSIPLDYDVPPTLPQVPGPPQQPSPKLPTPNVIKPVPKNPTVANKNPGFSNLPDLPNVPSDIPAGDIKEKDDEDEDFDELLNRFEDLKNNKK